MSNETITPITAQEETSDPQFNGVKKAVEEIEKTQEQELADFVASEENQKLASRLAHEVLDIAGKNWFTVLHFQTRSRLSKVVATQKLLQLKLFGLAAMKVADFAGVKTPMFKITLTKEARIHAINEAIAYHRVAIADLEKQLEKYQ